MLGCCELEFVVVAAEGGGDEVGSATRRWSRMRSCVLRRVAGRVKMGLVRKGMVMEKRTSVEGKELGKNGGLRGNQTPYV